MTPPPGERQAQRRFAIAAAAALAAAAAVLYWVPPGEGTLYPRCPFHASTGLHCPGCGATRSVHALLHGNLGQAFAYNGLLVVMLPFLTYAGVRAWIEGVAGRCSLPRVALPTWSVWMFVVILLLFGVFRNLPFFPFDLLAPHHLP